MNIIHHRVVLLRKRATLFCDLNGHMLFFVLCLFPPSVRACSSIFFQSIFSQFFSVTIFSDQLVCDKFNNKIAAY